MKGWICRNYPKYKRTKEEKGYDKKFKKVEPHYNPAEENAKPERADYGEKKDWGLGEIEKWKRRKMSVGRRDGKRIGADEDLLR